LTFIKSTMRYKEFFILNKLIDYNNNSSQQNCKSTRLDKKLDLLNIDNEIKVIIKNLLLSMLIIDPKKRCTIEYLDNHSFFN
jgi:hypothetical protein